MLYISKSIELIIGILIGIAYITLGERKVLGSIQRRVGPQVVGILQPIADGIKILTKENIIPNMANRYLSILGPIWVLYISIIIWSIIPINNKIVYIDNNLSILLWLAITSISVYGILFTGWSSHSKYSILGTIRGIAQVISYEISMSLIILSIFLINNTAHFSMFLINQIYIPNILIIWPIYLLFFISGLAEINRHPFDLLEGESEIVAGSIVEYSSSSFAYIYLAEYLHLITLGMLMNILFIGNFNYLIIHLFLLILIRGSLPRLRYDQLISLGWLIILPLSISLFIFYFSLFSILH